MPSPQASYHNDILALLDAMLHNSTVHLVQDLQEQREGVGEVHHLTLRHSADLHIHILCNHFYIGTSDTSF